LLGGYCCAPTQSTSDTLSELGMASTLDLIQAAEFLRVSRETMLELADAGELFGAKIGRAWVFLESDLVDYLVAQSRQQTTARRDRRLSPATSGRVPTAVTASAKAAHGVVRCRTSPNPAPKPPNRYDGQDASHEDWHSGAAFLSPCVL